MVLYEQHCEGDVPALFGEVRIGAASGAAPTLVRWPARDLGGGGQAVPVWFAPAAPVSSVSVVGTGAADFPVRVDDCTGVSGPCDVWVRFVPTAAGVREATLRVVDSGGGSVDVPLQGFAYGGTTGLTMTSDPGDYIGGGRAWNYGTDSSFGISGSRSGVHVGVDGANGDWWYLDFVPSDGDILAPGTYSGATRYPFNGTGPGLSIYGEGRGCNELDGSFTVNELTFSGSALRTMSISFEQHCEHGTPALRGTMSFRAGDHTAPAPWMVASNQPTPIGSSSQAASPASPPAAPPAAATGGAFSAPVDDAAAPRALGGDAGVRQAIAAQRTQVAAGTRRLTAALAHLRPAAVPKLSRLAARLATGIRHYRDALTATRASSAAMARTRTALLSSLRREATAVKSLRTALTRYRHGRPGATRAIHRAARALTTAAHAEATTT